jgi:hypothetical protein
MDRHDLVELRIGIGIERNRGCWRHHNLAAAHVDYQDLVSKPVHPYEFDRIAHGIIPLRLRCIWRKCGRITSGAPGFVRKKSAHL